MCGLDVCWGVVCLLLLWLWWVLWGVGALVAFCVGMGRRTVFWGGGGVRWVARVGLDGCRWNAQVRGAACWCLSEIFFLKCVFRRRHAVVATLGAIGMRTSVF